MDVVRTDSEAGKLVGYQGLGAGRFAAPFVLADGFDQAGLITWRDVDGDGVSELLFGEWDGLWRSPGIVEGELVAPVQWLVARLPEKLAWGDIGGDGTEDLVFLDERGMYVALRGRAPEQIDTGVTTVELLDVNSDGLLDVVYGSEDWLHLRLWREDRFGGRSSMAPFRPAGMIGRGGGQDLVAWDTEGQIWLATPGPADVLVVGTLLPDVEAELADMDGDGDLDAWIYEYEAPLRWWENRSDGWVFHNTGVLAERVVDIDGDGLVDLLRTYVNPSWWSSTDGYAARRALTIGGRRVQFEDLDGDGLVDAFGWGLGATLLVMRNEGAGVFEQWHYEPGSWGAPSAGDVDGDGDLDLVSVDHVADELVVYTNHGAGFDLPQGLGITETYFSRVEVVDLDEDGSPDIVTAGSELGWWRQDAGTFDSFAPIGLPQGYGGADFDIGDVDGDGQLDIVVDGPEWLSHGPGFQEVAGVVLGAGSANPTFAPLPIGGTALDLDGDGSLERVSTRPDGVWMGVDCRAEDPPFEVGEPGDWGPRPTTETETEEPGARDPDRGEPEKGACGCASAPLPGGWLGLVALVAIRRRSLPGPAGAGRDRR